jgi:hypothetical protein
LLLSPRRNRFSTSSSRGVRLESIDPSGVIIVVV